MKYAIRLFALLASYATLVAVVSAATVGGPTMGVWYNPSESGRGYEIDLQGDTMIVTTYVYEDSGEPIWYLSSGTYDHNTGVFTSTYDSYSDGQCFGCPYQAPTLHAGAAGPITVTFYTNQTATLTYPGGSTDLIKYQYGFPTRTAVLYGEWAFSYENAGAVSGDWIVFDTPYTDSAGNVYVSGHAAGDPATTALGIYNAAAFEAWVTVTAGTTQRFYQFGVFDDRRVIGQATVNTTGQPQAGPYTATGARLLYQGELSGGVIGTTDGQVRIAAEAAGQPRVETDAATLEANRAAVAGLQRAAAEFAATRR